MRANSYKDFTVWQKAIDLSVEVYRLAKLLPKMETYALSDQMRRAVISIRQTLLKVKDATLQKSSHISSALLAVLNMNWKRNFTFARKLATSQRKKSQPLLVCARKSARCSIL